MYTQVQVEVCKRTWGSRGGGARRVHRGSHSGGQTWCRETVQYKVLVLLHTLLKLQHDARHTHLCVVHLLDFFTYSCKLSTVLSNRGCHSFDALQQFLVSRVGGGCCEQVSIVTHKVSVDEAAPRPRRGRGRCRDRCRCGPPAPTKY